MYVSGQKLRCAFNIETKNIAKCGDCNPIKGYRPTSYKTFDTFVSRNHSFQRGITLQKKEDIPSALYYKVL